MKPWRIRAARSIFAPDLMVWRVYENGRYLCSALDLVFALKWIAMTEMLRAAHR